MTVRPLNNYLYHIAFKRFDAITAEATSVRGARVIYIALLWRKPQSVRKQLLYLFVGNDYPANYNKLII